MADKTLMEKINQGRQYRAMMLEIEKRAENEPESYRVRGYATTFNEPYTLYADGDWEYREQIDPNAFAGADMSDVIMQFDHAGKVYARTSNNTLALQVDGHGLLVTADLGSTEATRELYNEIQKGLITKMSFGFTVEEDQELRTTENDKEIWLRTITRIGKLYDVSAVSLPANDGTEISARSLVDGVIARRSQEHEDQQAKEQAEKEAAAKAEAEAKELRERERLRALALLNIGE